VIFDDACPLGMIELALASVLLPGLWLHPTASASRRRPFVLMLVPVPVLVRGHVRAHRGGMEACRAGECSTTQ